MVLLTPPATSSTVLHQTNEMKVVRTVHDDGGKPGRGRTEDEGRTQDLQGTYAALVKCTNMRDVAKRVRLGLEPIQGREKRRCTSNLMVFLRS